ncbi:MAG: phenylacetate--CoA ligase [Spirochaetota bacterium]|nr:MAG: phenylacetate--CoA ligase [Spirochaetota bacterium]
MDDRYWDKDIETMQRADLDQLQLKRLNETLKRASRSRFYEGKLPERLKSLEAIKEIPFTTKNNLRESFPKGMVAAPQEELIRLHSSSGTTGRATVIYHTRNDIDNWTELLARSMYMTGVRPYDVFQNMMGYGLFTGGLGLHYGSERLGALTIPASSGNSKRQIMLMKDFGTTVIHITPSYALHLHTIFEEEGVDPKRDLNLRIAFLGAEPYSDGTKRKIEHLYGINVFNSYGLSEMNGPGVAFECTHKDGMHVWEDNFFLEVIDPETGGTLEEGEEGELVFTTLRREGMPIIRYRSCDIGAVYKKRCPCGRTHRRITRIKGRTDDMLIIKGVNIYPMQVEKVLMDISEVGNNYLIEVDTVDYLDTLIIKIEVRPEIFHGSIQELENLRRRITEALRTETLISPKIHLVEPNSLPPSEGKAVRVVDKREKR